ncbi:hypothetical protein [Exiguobacterium alkaliphilum]
MLADVIERYIYFIESEAVYTNEHFENQNTGKLSALNKMLTDIEDLNEEEFLQKYLEIMDHLNTRYENGEFKEKYELNHLFGYTIAVKKIMGCVDPEFHYLLDDYFVDLNPSI